jgi:mannose-6-phosphate isomerase
MQPCRIISRMNKISLYPMTFEPLFQERIWGGRRLAELFDKALPADTPIGESWELADLTNGQSVVANGPLKGQTLRSLMEQYGPEITGKSDFSGPFPLLIKLLDAEDVLSVQVHPDAQTCRKMGTGEPKTECWYIVAARPGAVIYKGLKPGTTRQAFELAVRSGTCAGLLNRVPVEVGQCHFLPSGLCHAIGEGLVIAEIQQPSDTTYRVFDWNRTDAKTGKPRQLHIDQALESMHFDDAPLAPPTTLGRLVDAPEFKVDKGHQTPGCEALLKIGTMRVLVFLTGAGRIIAHNVETVRFSAGQTFLIPAAFEGVLQFEQDTEYLTVTV